MKAKNSKKRTAICSRKTKETDIKVSLNIDGHGKANINTGIGLLDHMLELFAFWGFFDLNIKAKGDSKKIDIHHTNEDIGIVLGEAFKKALGKMSGLKRSAYSIVPMEDIVATVVVDISGRSHFKAIEFANSKFHVKDIRGYSLEYANHFFEGFTKKLGINLAIKITGKNEDLHTVLEPIFKSLGKAMDEASQVDKRRKGVPSTKGLID